jgi:RNA polymerase sigma-70 factor (ECF subfamily)
VAALLVGQATSDQGLVRAATNGDAAAIEGLVVEFWPFAYRIAYLLLGERESAEEVAQDALLRAVTALDSFQPGRPFEPWLGRIAANCAYDAHRRSRRIPEPVEDAEAGLTAGDDDLADEIARNSLPDELERALAALRPEFRVAVVLRHLLDYGPDEIAEIVGVGAGTVRTRIHRGLVALRTALAETQGTTR